MPAASAPAATTTASKSVASAAEYVLSTSAVRRSATMVAVVPAAVKRSLSCLACEMALALPMLARMPTWSVAMVGSLSLVMERPAVVFWW